MSADYRLHPYSILFAFLTQIRLFVVPGILLAVGASSRSNDWWQWQPWMMLLIIPNAIFAVIRYATYFYRYDESELVIRSGLLFRRERHIPYARIQNIDAVQNLLHRLLRVVEVKLETGGGETAEATMSVLPIAGFQEMRERVFAERHAARPDATIAVGPTPLLALRLRELLLCGFIENRGAVLIAAGFGLIWELGLFDRLVAPLVGEPTIGRGVIRNFAASLFSSATVSWDRMALTVAAFMALLLAVRLVSMIWAAIRLYGFTVMLVDDDVRCEFGLFTRVAQTIPLRRVQVLTVREGLLHRWFDRVAVKVDTAGGREYEEVKSDREHLAPILHRRALPEFVRAIVGVELTDVVWNRPHERAFRREVKPWLAMALVISIGLGFYLRWAALPLVPLLLAWAVVAARQTVRHLGWAETADAVLFKRGWILRRLVIVPLGKMQVVTLHESPFDRRMAMASVHVDTAGASGGSVVHIPYLAASIAGALHLRLAAAAAGTQFKW
jgi:putative membrane protein